MIRLTADQLYYQHFLSPKPKPVYFKTDGLWPNTTATCLLARDREYFWIRLQPSFRVACQRGGAYGWKRCVVEWSIQTWRSKTITCTYHAKAATLKKIKHYQKMLVNNMAYSPISLNHIQQKTDLLTIAVIRKRRRCTANMAVTCIVSSSEHFCMLFCTFFLLLFLFLFLSLKDILNAILCRNIIPIFQTGSYLMNEVSIWKWASTR